MEKFLKSVLISEKEIDEITTRIAGEISRDFSDSGHLVLVAVLKGSVVFMGDLMKKISVPAEIDFIKASSYGKGTKSSGSVKILLDMSREDLSDLDIVIVEDIVDSGNTLKFLTEHLYRRGAHTVKTCTMLDKPSRRQVDFKPDYCGRQIPDEFVIGYGLDYDEKYRTLPFVGILDPSAINNN